jgi:hypothetical protein
MVMHLNPAAPLSMFLSGAEAVVPGLILTALLRLGGRLFVDCQPAFSASISGVSFVKVRTGTPDGIHRADHPIA